MCIGDDDKIKYYYLSNTQLLILINLYFRRNSSMKKFGKVKGRLSYEMSAEDYKKDKKIAYMEYTEEQKKIANIRFRLRLIAALTIIAKLVMLSGLLTIERYAPRYSSVIPSV